MVKAQVCCMISPTYMVSPCLRYGFDASVIEVQIQVVRCLAQFFFRAADFVFWVTVLAFIVVDF